MAQYKNSKLMFELFYNKTMQKKRAKIILLRSSNDKWVSDKTAIPFCATEHNFMQHKQPLSDVSGIYLPVFAHVYSVIKTNKKDFVRRCKVQIKYSLT